MNRHNLIYGAVACAAAGLLVGEAFAATCAGLAPTEILRRVNDRLAREFISHDGLLLDYVGEIPMAAEIADLKPNAMGWWCPIENGSMFTGEWLPALMSEGAARKALVEKCVRGLVRMSEVSDVPGFIARGTGTDGQSHHPCGSNDQTDPWFFGLCEYCRWPHADPALKAKALERLVFVARALERNGWGVPCDGAFKGENRGNLNAKAMPFWGKSRLLYSLKSLHRLTGDAHWGAAYESLKAGALDEIEAGGEVDAKVFTGTYGWGVWIYLSSVQALARLAEMEENPSDRARMRKGLLRYAERIAPLMKDRAKYANTTERPFRYANWRTGYAWRVQKTQKDAEAVAHSGKREILGTRKDYERSGMSVPLCAAAICALSGEAKYRDEILATLRHYDYSTPNVSEFFHAAVAVQHLPPAMKIQQAIDAAWRAGGGRVVVPAGVHHVGGLRLRSNVELHLAAHAVLSASRNCDDFDILAGDKLEPIAPQLIADARGVSLNAPRDRTKTWIGATNCVVRWNNAIIRLVGATNVVISGEAGSAIDGNNSYDPDGEERYRGVHGICCFHSSNVVVRGVELRHTGNWATRFAYSDDLLFEGLSIRGGHDGVHVRGCNRIRVRDCTILTGDDSVAGFGNDGLTVSNCTLSSSANMLRLGGRNILIEDCEARGPCPYPFRGWLTDEQKRLGTGAVPDLPRGRYTAAVFFTYFCDWSQPVYAVPENIVVRRCRIENVHRFLRYNYGGETWQHQMPTPEITFENCTVKGLLLPSIANARGEGEKIVMPFTLRLRDSSFAFLRPVESFVECQNVACLDFKNVRVHGVDGDIPAAASWMGTPKLSFEGVSGLKPEVVPRHGQYKWVFRCDENEVRALYGNRRNAGDVKKVLSEPKTVPVGGSTSATWSPEDAASDPVGTN